MTGNVLMCYLLYCLKANAWQADNINGQIKQRSIKQLKMNSHVCQEIIEADVKDF